MSTAVKINSELVDSARGPAVFWNRSTTAQIEYWARIGRAFEAMADVRQSDIRAALEARIDFDSLAAPDKAQVLAGLESELFAPAGDSGFHAGKSAEGLSYTVLDDEGRIVEVQPDGSRTVISDAGAYLDASAP